MGTRFYEGGNLLMLVGYLIVRTEDCGPIVSSIQSDSGQWLQDRFCFDSASLVVYVAYLL